MKQPIIALLTDFGLSDHYVGVLKGVISNINPNATMIDITHLIEPQNIRQGAILLQEVYPYYPKGTIFVAVVDPGVGSSRDAICIKTSKGYLIGPDNGLFSFILANERSYEIRKIENDKYFRRPLSATFHARDIFAPAAAHLSKQDIFKTLGRKLKRIGVSWNTVLKWSDESLVGEIVYIDRFGNGITNISKSEFKKANKTSQRVKLKSKEVSMKEFFAEGKKDELIAVWNSSQLLEFAVPNDSAEKKYEIKVGDSVEVSTL